MPQSLNRRNGRGPSPEPRDLSNWGATDTEVLGIVDDVCREGDGFASTYDIRLRFGEHPEDNRRTGVPSRLSWQRRYGWLDRADDGRWYLTEYGRQILLPPKLPARVASGLETLNLAQRITLTKELGQAGAEAPPEVQTAIRRQWQHSQGHWRR